MSKLSIAMVLAGLVTIAGVAEAKKPTVCLTYTETTLTVDGAPQKVAICTSGKKPVILTSYSVVTVKDDNGENVKAVVGYR